MSFWKRKTAQPEPPDESVEAKFRSHHRIAVEHDPRNEAHGPGTGPWSAWVERTFYRHGTWFQRSDRYHGATEEEATHRACVRLESYLADLLVETNRKYVSCEM